MDEFNTKFSFKIKNAFYDVSRPQKWEWILLGILFFFFFSSYLYTDILFTTRHGLNLWDTLFSGQIRDFYLLNKNAYVSDGLTCSALYDFPIYIAFAVWNFPLWLLEHFADVKVLNNPYTLLYAKSILIFALWGCNRMVGKICKEIHIKEGHILWCQFIFISSSFVLSSLVLMSQYDIIGLFFTLLGVYYFIKGDNNKFVFWFAIAIAFKLFAVLVFIPLILLTHKKVVSVFFHVLCGLSLVLFTKLYFPQPEDVGNFLIGSLRDCIRGPELGIGDVSLFVVGYVTICIYCYMKTITDNKELQRYGIYMPFATWMVFFMFTKPNPYWTILITPYFAIMLFQNPKILKTNLYLHMAGSSVYILAQMIQFPWCYSYQFIMPKMPFANLIKPFGPVEPSDNFIDLGLKEQIPEMTELGIPIFLGVFVAAAMISLIINHPSKDNSMIQEGVILIERSVIWSRIFIGMGLISFPMLTYFILQF